jgi:hypothetical protein
MRGIGKGSRVKIRRQTAAMLELHARALHMPHIRRYHATRRQQSKTYDKAHPAFGSLREKWSLPVYLLDLTATTVDLRKVFKIGRIQFLNWNSAMPAVSEIQQDSRLLSVATGAGAAAQHRIVQRILSQEGQMRRLAIVSIPVLHFRGLVYARHKDGDQMIVPLRTSMVSLNRGKTYSSDFVLQELKAALAHRINAARRIRVGRR